MKSQTRIRFIAFTALFGALSGVIMLLKFPLPFMPPFFEMDFSPVIEMIGGYILGPISAIIIIVIKILLKMLLSGSHSFGVGELSNLLLSLVYVLPGVLIYKYKKNKTTGIIGLIVGTILTAIVAIFTNLFLMFPFYETTMHVDIISICQQINPAIKSNLTLALIGIVPFNIIKNGVCSVITIFVYKRVSKAIKNIIYKYDRVSLTNEEKDALKSNKESH